MNNYYLIPFFSFENKLFDSEIMQFLSDQLDILTSEFDKGFISISNCMNAQLCLSSLDKSSKWLLEVMRKNLLIDGTCTAYSKNYVSQLNNFDQQAFQRDVYTEYYYWKILLINEESIPNKLVENILGYQNKSGYFYNSSNSNTSEKYRMKSELYGNLLMATEIIDYSNQSSSTKKDISNKSFKTEYLSSEYFRDKYCSTINKEANTKESINHLLESCKIEYGLCDFNTKNKTDDFMGTRKRTARDKSIFSPLATLHGIYLCQKYNLQNFKKQLIDESHEYFEKYKLELESFKMRDLPIDFGPGKTVVEVLAFNTILNMKY